MGDYQRRFEAGRSTIKANDIINQIFQRAKEENRQLYVPFIDIKSVFDIVRRPELMEELEELMVPTKCWKSLTRTISTEIKFNRRLIQGDANNPALFFLLWTLIKRPKMDNRNIITPNKSKCK